MHFVDANSEFLSPDFQMYIIVDFLDKSLTTGIMQRIYISIFRHYFYHWDALNMTNIYIYLH